MDTAFNAGNGIGPNRLEAFNFFYAPKTDAIMSDPDNTKSQSHADYSNEEGYISGHVFWNNAVNFDAQTMGAAVTDNGNEDPAARNVTVTGSYLSDYALSKIYSDGKAYMGKDIRGTGWSDADEMKLQAWIKEQIASEGKNLWIAETVTTTTDANGLYELQFNGTYGRSYNDPGYDDGVLIYTDLARDPAVKAEYFNKVAASPTDGTWYKDATGRGMDQYPKHVNLQWTYVSLGGVDGYGQSSPYLGNKWTGWGTAASQISPGTTWTNLDTFDAVADQHITDADFGLFLDQVSFDVTPYDSYDNYAVAGQTVNTTTAGLPSSDLGDNKYQIAWFDQNGNELTDATCPVQIPSSTGTLTSCDFTTPADLTEQTTYTAKLFSVGTDGVRASYPIAQDSFTVDPAKKTDTENNDPKYIDGTFTEGTGGTIKAPTFDDPNTTDVVEQNAAPTNGATSTTFGTPDGATLPTGVVVNADGSITIGADTPAGEYTVPVLVTYPDGTLIPLKCRLR